jgi:uncharacterized SAM-binding protein YcdF (DUF218 family)
MRLPSLRAWQRACAVVAAVVIAFALATARLLIWPSAGMPARVDAIVLLAGPGDRIPEALRLASGHRAPVLVVSLGQHGYGEPCPRSVVSVICFEPDPGDTRGEAEYVGRLGKARGWHSIVLVTSSEQATRARIMMQRCYAGSVYVMTAPVPASQVPYEIAYGWGALAKAFAVKRSC